MSSIEAQLELERQMKERGADNFDRSQNDAESAGRGAETAYARRLMREFMLPLIENLTYFLQDTKPVKQGKIRPLLVQCPPDKAMYIAMHALFNHFTNETQLVQLVTKIGKMVEDEIRFTKFQDMFKEYYDEIKKDFKRKGTKDYRYMHRVLTHKANEKSDHWIEWSQSERADIGLKLLDIILENTDLIQKNTYRVNGRMKTVIVPTDAARKWIEEHNETSKFMFPDKMPCIIVPDEWTALDQGGYYSPELRCTTPLVKTTSKKHKAVLLKANLTKTMEAANILQAMPWAVNEEVLSVLKAVWAKNLRIGMPASEPLTIPTSPVVGKEVSTLSVADREAFMDWKHEAAEIHTKEKERVSKSYQVSRIIRMANEYSRYNQFYYVWYSDFRGRLYTTTAGFSPQGPDLAKGILRFARSKSLGPRGWFWLRVHGANRYGYDKDDYAGRVAWVDSQREQFLAAANDPLSYTGIWANADKPWQFLAFLFEYRDALALESLGIPISEYKSSLPIGLDGSCNGLQNFSAMLRDSKGGIATNLVPASKPSDIYAEVAKVCYAKLANYPTDPIAQKWKLFCDKHGSGTIPRALAKRPVMTLPYGATKQSCTKYIFENIMEIDRDLFEGNFKAACWLTPLLWDSIGEVVVAAREAMDWLQKSATCISRFNVPIQWKAIDGFPIYQATRVIESVQIETQLAGRFQIRIGKFTDDMNRNKQRLGVSPNFVHSCDAAHLRATVRAAAANGISDMALIHDDYGTHACDTDKLHELLRAAFVAMYSVYDPLDSFRAANETAVCKLPKLPAKGDLDIAGVMQSEYFFG